MEQETPASGDKPVAMPDVESDRALEESAATEGHATRPKRPPLAIQEIENLEDDAKGG